MQRNSWPSRRKFSQLWLWPWYETEKIKIKILLYSWLPIGAYDTSLAIWKKFLDIWRIRAHYFPMKPCVEVEIMFSRSKEVREFARKIITALNIMIAMCGLSNCLRIIIKMIYPYLRVFFGELLHTGNRCSWEIQNIQLFG